MSKAKLHPEWKLLVERYSDAPYGRIVDHEEIESATGLNRKKAPMEYYRQTVRWKKAMLYDFDRAVQVIVNRGYKIIEPDEYRGHTRKIIKEARTRLQKSGKVSDVAPIDLMTTSERTKMLEMQAHVSALAHFFSEHMKHLSLRSEPQKPETLLLNVGDVPLCGAVK